MSINIVNITIIGTGNMGLPLAKYLGQADHRVFLGSRDESKASRIAAEIGFGVKGESIQDAVKEGDIIFIAVPHAAINETLEKMGSLDNKVVVDMSNCFKPDFSGLTIGHTTSAAEEIARQIPNAKVVKAFNTIFATILNKGLNFENQVLNVFLASDDEQAKQSVSELVESIGLLPVDCGKLKSSRFLEPLSALILQIDSNLKREVQIAPAIIERARSVA